LKAFLDGENPHTFPCLVFDTEVLVMTKRFRKKRHSALWLFLFGATLRILHSWYPGHCFLPWKSWGDE